MVIWSPDAEITPRFAATAPASGIRTDTAPSTMTVSPAIHAITLDLDDTLWPMKPALIEAERALSAWMAERTPRASALLTPDTRAALRAGVVAGAGLDVFEHEPAVPAELQALPNAVLTPHIAGNTLEAQAAMERMVCANIDAFVAGRPVPTPVPGSAATYAPVAAA